MASYSTKDPDIVDSVPDRIGLVPPSAWRPFVLALRVCRPRCLHNHPRISRAMHAPLRQGQPNKDRRSNRVYPHSPLRHTPGIHAASHLSGTTRTRIPRADRPSDRYTPTLPPYRPRPSLLVQGGGLPASNRRPRLAKGRVVHFSWRSDLPTVLTPACLLPHS